MLLTATQNIAQCGYDESETSKNKGNFCEILNVVGNHDPFIKKRLEEGPRNAKYTSKVIQNYILDCLARMVLDEILKEVKVSEYFSVETKDMSKKEQMSVVLRYYYDGVVRESFLGFSEAKHLDVSCLEKFGLKYRENLVGQGYDGASVMSGNCFGVQAI